MPLTPTEQREAQVRAVVEKAPAAPPTTAVQERANQIRDKVNSSGSRAALESFVDPAFENQADRQKKIDSVLHWETDASGMKVRAAGTPEATRFNDAKSNDELQGRIVEVGYDNLTTTEKTKARQQIEEAVRERLPDVADALLGPIGGAAAANKQEIIENILKDPNFLNSLRKGHSNKLEGKNSKGENVIKTTDEKIIEAKRKKVEAEEADTKKQAEINKLGMELTDIQTALDKYNAGGANRQILDKLNADTPKLNAEIEQLELKIESLKDLVHQLRVSSSRNAAGGGTVPQNLSQETTKQESALNSAIRSMENKKAQIAERDRLAAEEVKLKQEKDAVQNNLDKANGEKAETEKLKAIAAADFDLVKGQREIDETEYIKGIGNSVKDAFAEFMQEKLKESQKHEEEILTDEAAKTADSDKKKVLEGLQQKGLKKNSKNHLELDKDESRKFGGEILSNGLDGYIERWLKSPGPITADENARIDAKLKDDTFMKDMRAHVGPTLIARYLKAGGRFTEGDIDYLRSTDWGVNMISGAIEKNNSLKEEVNKRIAEGVLDKNFLDKLKSVDGGTWGKLLLLLILGAVTVGVAPAVLGVAASVKGSI